MSLWFKIISLDLLLGVDEVGAEVMLVATIHVVGGGPGPARGVMLFAVQAFVFHSFFSVFSFSFS
jgi:hypothetical protein